MYLSRLILNPRSRSARWDISNPYEMHRTLLNAFPDKEDGGPGRVTWRLDSVRCTGAVSVLVQSENEPDWGFFDERQGYLADPPEAKPLNLSFRPGQKLAFRLRANPTVKKKTEGKKNGKRFGLVREEDQEAWLRRKADQGGFTIHGVRITPENKVTAKRSNEARPMILLSARFDGLLEVTDPKRFKETFHSGIGPAKSFGFGLLSLAPIV